MEFTILGTMPWVLGYYFFVLRERHRWQNDLVKISHSLPGLEKIKWWEEIICFLI